MSTKRRAEQLHQLAFVSFFCGEESSCGQGSGCVVWGGGNGGKLPHIKHPRIDHSLVTYVYSVWTLLGIHLLSSIIIVW